MSVSLSQETSWTLYRSQSSTDLHQTLHQGRAHGYLLFFGALKIRKTYVRQTASGINFHHCSFGKNSLMSNILLGLCRIGPLSLKRMLAGCLPGWSVAYLCVYGSRTDVTPLMRDLAATCYGCRLVSVVSYETRVTRLVVDTLYGTVCCSMKFWEQSAYWANFR